MVILPDEWWLECECCAPSLWFVINTISNEVRRLIWQAVFGKSSRKDILRLRVSSCLNIWWSPMVVWSWEEVNRSRDVIIRNAIHGAGNRVTPRLFVFFISHRINFILFHELSLALRCSTFTMTNPRYSICFYWHIDVDMTGVFRCFVVSGDRRCAWIIYY